MHGGAGRGPGRVPGDPPWGVRSPLPDGLPTIFTARDAAAAGVSRSRLRARDLRRPFRGVYAREAEAEAEERLALTERARAAAAVLGEGAFFSHVTAAALWEIPLPFRVTAGRDLDAGEVHPHRPPRIAGIRGHRVQPAHVRVVTHPDTGLRVASPASTWAMLGAELRHPYDLIAAAEAVVSDRCFGRDDPLARIDQLEAAAFAGRRVGINSLRAALPEVRLHVASRTETWLRLTIVAAGLPEPQINMSVLDDDGEFIGIVDLTYPGAKVAIEYEGEHHMTDPVQWAKDILRYERLAAAGWWVIRITKDELFHHSDRVVSRVRTALRNSGVTSAQWK